jgi:trehalose/maltose transport system permease protein
MIMAHSASPAVRRMRAIGFYVVAAILLFYLLFPFYWAVVTSMKSGTGLFQVDFLPPVNLSNYWGVFAQGPFGLNILNSVIVAVSVVILSLVIALFASYALGRIRFRGRAALLLLVLGVSMFPQVAVLSGMFELVRALGIYNKLSSLILAYMIFTLPFTVWVLTTFMRQLPRELEEAAMVDGAAPWQILFKIFLPIMGPALVTTGLLAFIAAWNEFLFAITFILNPDVRTVPVAIALISGASQYDLPFGTIMAASIIVTLPLIVLVLIFQRLIVSGLTAGAVKG